MLSYFRIELLCVYVRVLLFTNSQFCLLPILFFSFTYRGRQCGGGLSVVASGGQAVTTL